MVKGDINTFHHAWRSYTGIIDAMHESGCIKGAGRIEVLPKGTILVFRRADRNVRWNDLTRAQ